MRRCGGLADQHSLLFLAGGSETTSTALRWAIKYLSRRPDVQDRLHTELAAQIGYLTDRAPSCADLADAGKLPYLQAVVHEVLRCANTAGFTARDTTIDTVILGHRVPKGTTVMLMSGIDGMADETEEKRAALDPVRSASSTQHGAGYGFWKDAKTFEPARWLKDGIFDPNAGPSMPFGGGVRGCYGKQLAMLNLRLFIAIIVLNFKLGRIDPAYDSDAADQLVTRIPAQVFVDLSPRS